MRPIKLTEQMKGYFQRDDASVVWRYPFRHLVDGEIVRKWLETIAQYSAVRVFKAFLALFDESIINDSEIQSVYFLVAKKNLDMLKALVDGGYKDINGIDRVSGHCVYYYAHNFMEMRIAEKVEYLVSINASVYARDLNGAIAIDHSVRFIGQRFIERDAAIRVFTAILNKMKQECTGRFPVPMHVVWRLHKELLLAIFDNYCGTSRAFRFPYPDLYSRLRIQLLNMLLDTGANISLKCSASTPSCKCKVKLPQFRMCSLTFARLIAYSVNTTDPGLFHFIGDLYKKLLRYGNKPDKSLCTFLTQIVSYETEQLYHYAEVSLSLMDHEDWLFVQRRFSRLHHRLDQSNPTSQKEQDDKERKQELIKCYQGPKSLRHMCRKVLYDNVPDRRMAVHIKQLKMPINLEPYILLE